MFDKYTQSNKRLKEIPENERCLECHGTGMEICDNPDHGFIQAMPRDIGRIGCPLCGHDDLHRIYNSICATCKGTGRINEPND